ncbi:hypothetical protein V2W45_1229416, partial [Cenococcum geophilum]
YINRILKPLLYLYYIVVKKANSNKEVWLIKDNIALHRKLSYLAKELGILFIDYPFNSPNLHLIKRCFRRLNYKVNIYNYNSALKAAKKAVRE